MLNSNYYVLRLITTLRHSISLNDTMELYNTLTYLSMHCMQTIAFILLFIAREVLNCRIIEMNDKDVTSSFDLAI